MRGRSCCDSRRGANASPSGSRSLVSCRSPPEASPFLIERFPGRFEAEPRPESRSAPAQDARLSPCWARCWEEQSVSRGRSPARGGRLPLTPRPRLRTTPPISLSKDRGVAGGLLFWHEMESSCLSIRLMKDRAVFTRFYEVPICATIAKKRRIGRLQNEPRRETLPAQECGE